MYDYNRQQGTRAAATLKDLNFATRDLVGWCRELHTLAGRLAEQAKAKPVKSEHPKVTAIVLRYVKDIDAAAQKMTREVEEELGLGSDSV